MALYFRSDQNERRQDYKMYIKSLKVSKSGEIIREINFKKGANLIVDETPSEQLKKSGNNVGKTTILRLIDFCLGGDGEKIYLDQEFKEKNKSRIEEFLKKEGVLISLILVEDLNETTSPPILIERNFLEEEDRICKINGEQYNDLKQEFQPKLKELIFKSKNRKPTFRQIISKNIRDEKNRMTNVLRTLHPTTTFGEYESLYLFWLGIDINTLDEKQELERSKSIEKNLQMRLKNEGSLSEITQSLHVVEKNILEVEGKRNYLSKNENYEKDLSELNSIKSNLNRMSTQLTQLEARRDLILESKEDLEKEQSRIDSSKIKYIYSEAKALIPNLQKTFDETLDFHNETIKGKINFITQELPQLEQSISGLKKKISLALAEEREFIDKLEKLETIEQLEQLAVQLNSLYEKKGRFEEKKNIWEKTQKELKRIETRLSAINEEIESKKDLIETRIAKFNEYFSTLSDKLYGEKFILSSDQNKGGYELNISSFEGNLGTGKKKGLIVAFDFAYLQFAESLNIKYPHFILHDQIETVHNNQIRTIFDLADEIDCQYIVPVLKDKLPSDLNINTLKIISLSQSDKLFKIP